MSTSCRPRSDAYWCRRRRPHTGATPTGSTYPPETAHRRDPDGFDVPATHRRVWDFSRDGVHRSLEESLTRLGLDRIDVVYLHDPDDHWEQAAAEGVPALIELRDQGVVGAIGAGMNQSAMLARFVRETDVDVVMCAGRYTLLEQGASDDLLPVAETHGVGVVIAGVYNSGLLASERPPADATYDYQQAPAELIERVKAITSVCETYSVTLPEAALAFVRPHQAVVSTVVGVRNPAQVIETLRRAKVHVPRDLWSALRAEGLLARCGEPGSSLKERSTSSDSAEPRPTALGRLGLACWWRGALDPQSGVKVEPQRSEDVRP